MPDLKSHVDRVHRGIKKFFCDVCKIAVGSKDHFLIHSDLRPHSCEECKKQFKLINNLQKHAITHSVLKPYHCSTCYKAFKTKSYLDVHLKVHTKERPHKCNTCEKSF